MINVKILSSLKKKIIPIDKHDISLIKRASRYLKPYIVRMILTFLCICAGICLGLISPYCYGKIFTSCFIDKEVQLFIQLILILLGTNLVIMIVQFLQGYLFSTLNENIIITIKKDMHAKILNLPVKQFDKIGVGEFISRLDGDSNIIASILTDQFLTSIMNIMRVIIVGITTFRISWKLFIIVLITLPLSHFIFTIFGKVLRKRNSELALLRDSIFKKIQETLSGIRDIKGLGLKQRAHNEYTTINTSEKNKNIHLHIIQSIMDTSVSLVSHLSEIVVLIAGFYLILKGELKVEMFIAFSLYLNQFQGSLESIIQLNATIQKAMVSFARIFDVIDSFNEKQETFGTIAKKEIRGTISFHNVWFSYNKKKSILKGISFEIPANSKVALVGNSGAGKTTIFNLILRFYEINKGLITIDSTNVNLYSERTIREAIAYVSQEPFLFNKSISENILLGNSKATSRDVEEVCEIACINDYIQQLPNKYNTFCGERGGNLSIGQKQRIAIARALIKGSSIILLDEASSALDNTSQFKIKQALENIYGSRTIVIIAHRLFTIIDADIIYVLDKGKIIGKGDHKSLMKNNQLYNELYRIEVDTLVKNNYKGKTEEKETILRTL